jgi:hypothetical protein
MNKIVAILKARAKAIAALLAPVVVALAARYGFHIDVNTVTVAITSVLAGLAVHTVTNTPAAPAVPAPAPPAV